MIEIMMIQKNYNSGLKGKIVRNLSFYLLTTVLKLIKIIQYLSPSKKTKICC